MNGLRYHRESRAHRTRALIGQMSLINKRSHLEKRLIDTLRNRLQGVRDVVERILAVRSQLHDVGIHRDTNDACVRIRFPAVGIRDLEC